MKQRFFAAMALGVSLTAFTTSAALAQSAASAAVSPATLGAAQMTAQTKEAATLLLSSVKAAVSEDPSLADSVGDRAMVKAVERATASRPDLSVEIGNVAKKLKPHLSQSIDLASTNAVAFDGAVGAVEEAAPPAWASAPADAPMQGGNVPAAAANGDVPEWAMAGAPLANDAGGVAAGSAAVAGGMAGGSDVFALGLEDLMNTKVVTASKSQERAFEVPAAIYVITNEDLRRSGHASVQEALRMVPGFQVSQFTAGAWSVASRGFGDEYSNKLLVMVDGRSVYTPTFSGVYWDNLNMPLEDIDRIEVIRGPGATIWGANAVNGVINIVTKDSKYTQGAYVSGGVGVGERAFGEGRVGGKLEDYGHYRMYSRYIDRDRTEGLDGRDRHNAYWRLLTGFRTDWKNSHSDALSLQGEIQKGGNEQESTQLGVGDDSEVLTSYLRGKWDRVLDNGSSISLNSYLDHDYRKSVTLDLRVTNFNLDFNHNVRWADRNDLVWGLGYRLSADEYVNTPILGFFPEDDVKNLYSAFIQNKFEATKDLDLTLGTKIEHNAYTGFEVQPTAKFSYRPGDKSTIWGSVARAVRTPSRVEDSINIILQEIPANPPFVPLPTQVIAQGNSGVQSEEMIAYELGYRISPAEGLIMDIAAYYNDYDSITTLRPGAPIVTFPTITVPVGGANGGEAQVYGVELSTSWQVTPSWKLAGYYAYSKLELDTVAGDQPFLYYDRLWAENSFSLRSSYNITENLEWDAALYYMASLDDALNVDNTTPFPIDAYWRGDMRLGWRPLDNLELSLVGQNLLEGNHVETIDSRFTESTQIGRTYYGKATWRF